LELSFFGFRVVVRSEGAGVCERLARDFSDHVSEGRGEGAAMEVAAELREPEWDLVSGRRFFRHFNGDVLGWGDERWVRYENAAVHYDARKNRGRVMSAHEHLLYHYTYYLVIAKVGEALDLRGLHRFHSLGVSIAGTPALFPMPISGGKTTLALSLLEDPEIGLYSEDTPLIDARGRVHPFAVRLSLRREQAARFPAERLRLKKDPVFGDKHLLDLEYFGLDRVRRDAGERPVLFWGRKSRQEEPAVARMGSLRSLYLLLVFVILGKDCPQRAELFLRLSPGGLRMMAAIFLRRSVAAIQLWRASTAYWFHMTPDVARNAAFVKSFFSGARGERRTEELIGRPS
jgi:hypothetical protein